MSAQQMDDGDFFDRQVTDAVEEIVDRRAVTEQTKGMLMFVYGVGADEAFAVLRRQSQDHNIKLTVVAEQIQKDLLDLSRSKSFDRGLAADLVVRTAHRRVDRAAERLLDDESKIRSRRLASPEPG